MLIPDSAHKQHNWRVFSLAPDFLLEDVWQFPIDADPSRGDSLALFKREAFLKAFNRLSQQGPAGALFKLRSFLGKVFSWDERADAVEVINSQPGSVRRRYLDEGGSIPADSADVDLNPSDAGFFPVYELENESLAEIKNKTIHALMHLGWVEREPDCYTVQMAVYVKTHGLLSKGYMALIKPFRLWIVYPAIMKMVAAEWRRFQAKTAQSQV